MPTLICHWLNGVHLMVRMMVLTACIAISACQVTDSEQEASSAQVQPSITGSWRVKTVMGESVGAESKSYLRFEDANRLSGNSGCNQFFGEYHYTDTQLTLAKDLASTRKMCLPAIMQQEQHFTRVLSQALSVTVDQSSLQLQDQNGAVVLEATLVNKL
ncbi:META domain-containing protein [Gilvimarinus sp. SDUM040013]|uniref:META domain-containing protein n=1 Tax=Gilvimarinus gilvus TaxID=3058038 RepID=A0ABU4RYR1_9GAMM|nr:META domain-containing protein [Gilvimarinus sp. SDUM040013]MDO3385708.1 META domain-containing protein [Gilvimarinus sp. SDUM040013]MDX6849347.1 META domain-containing protein [Gilvimarinus sp. SDUM040013]